MKTSTAEPNEAPRILLIDDEEAVTETYKGFLEDEAYFFEATNNPQSAWQLLEKNVYDLIITDLHMPHVNGDELIEIIRKNKNHQVVPVIIASGTSNKLHEDKVKRDPDLFLIKKPFTKEEFLSKVRCTLTFYENK